MPELFAVLQHNFPRRAKLESQHMLSAIAITIEEIMSTTARRLTFISIFVQCLFLIAYSDCFAQTTIDTTSLMMIAAGNNACQRSSSFVLSNRHSFQNSYSQSLENSDQDNSIALNHLIKSELRRARRGVFYRYGGMGMLAGSIISLIFFDHDAGFVATAIIGGIGMTSGPLISAASATRVQSALEEETGVESNPEVWNNYFLGLGVLALPAFGEIAHEIFIARVFINSISYIRNSTRFASNTPGFRMSVGLDYHYKPAFSIRLNQSIGQR